MAGTTDMAALAAGVVAIAVSVIGEPGRYDSMDFVIGLSMLLIFAGYVMDNPRRPLQSVAVAAVVALSILPVFGFVFERATTAALEAAIVRAVAVYADKPRWARMMQSAMSRDYSWAASAAQYRDLYGRLLPESTQAR